MVTKYHSLRNGFSPNQIFIASATPKKRKSRFGIFPERVIFFFSFLFCRCQFPSGALTGNLNVDHAMCVLSLNIINDKIFLLEWIWFYILGAALKNYANDLPFVYDQGSYFTLAKTEIIYPKNVRPQVLQACCPWVCRVCQGTPGFWQIS